MKQTWKKQLHRKLLASTAVLVGVAIALPVIGTTTQKANAAPAAKEVNGPPQETDSGTTTYNNTDGVGVYVHNIGQLTENGLLDVTTSNSGTAVGHPAEHGIQIDGTGSSVTLNDGANITLDASTLYSNGINITNGGNLTTSGTTPVTVNLNGENTAGVYMSGLTSTINSTGTIAVNVIENGNYGYQQQEGTSTLNILNIDVQQPSGATGLEVSGGTLTANTVNIQTNGGTNSSTAVLSKNPGSKITIGSGEVDVNSSTPDTYADSGGSALRAENQSEIDVTGSIILNTSIVSGEVVRATGGSTIDLDNAGYTTSITSNSDISNGLSIGRLQHAYETGSGIAGSTIISNGNLDITTNKATSYGIGLTGNGANLQTGANSSANIQSVGTAIKFEAGDSQSATLNNATITNGGQAGSYRYSSAPGWNQITDPTEQHNDVDNAGNLFQVGGNDAINSLTSYSPTDVYTTYQDNSTNSSLTLNNSTATAGGGKLLMDVRSSDPNNGSTFTFNNNNTKLYGGIATQTGSTLAMNLTNGSSWNIDQNSNVTDLTNDNSAIVFDPGSPKTLTVNTFTVDPGQGSSITENVFADGNNTTSDQLIINNSYSGPPTQIIPVITGGSGKLPDSGVSLVTGAVSPNDFYANPTNYGFYTYTGEFSNSSGSPQFVLHDQLDSAVASVSVLPTLGSQVALATLPSVQDRMHAPRLSVTGTGTGDADKGIWARIFGGSYKFRSNDSGDNGYNNSLWAVQAGYDLMAKKDANGGRSYAGLYAAYGNSSGNSQVNGHDVGSLDLNATSVGAYWTKYTPSDAYLSVTGQYSMLNGIKASGGGESVNPNGSGFAISLEGGKTFHRDKSIMIEPQAQLIYQHTNIDDSVLAANQSRPTATPISLSNLNAVTGRLGLLFQKNPDSGNNFLPWARINLLHTFNGDSSISTPGNDDISTSMTGTSAELEAGFNLLGNKDSNWAIDAGAGYQFNISGARDTGWLGTLGVRYDW